MKNTDDTKAQKHEEITPVGLRWTNPKRLYDDGIEAARQLTDPVTKEAAIEFLTRYSNNATRFILFLHLSQYHEMTADAYAAALRMSYSEFMTISREKIIDSFYWLRGRADTMTPEEQQTWEALPVQVTIYRGCDIEEAESGIFNLSWTFSRALAEFIAWRFNEKDRRRVVVQKTINKGYIMGYFSDRMEKDVIVDVTDGAEIIARQPTEAYYEYIARRRH